MSAQKKKQTSNSGSKSAKIFSDLYEAIKTFSNGDYGEDYKHYAKTNLKNGHYGLALLQFIDGCIEYTKDIFTVPAAKATAAATVEVANQAAGLVGINTNSVKLNAGQQSKHIKGHNNYIHGRSILYGNLDDAQDLLNKYAGTGQRINEQKERVNFGKIIGVYVNPETGESLETTWGLIHTGKNGAHIVPAIPQ